MCGIIVHTQDPIHPTKAEAIFPQMANQVSPEAPSRSPISNASMPQRYAPARPGAVIPTPTSTVDPSLNNGPPPPQPGAFPVANPPLTTAKPSLPPPPKVGEKPQAPEYYTPVQSQHAQQQRYPAQLSHPSLGSGITGLPPASTTSTTTTPSFLPTVPPTKLPEAAEDPRHASLEHPPGYVQDPYASEMTSDQRFATEQQAHEVQPETLPSFGHISNHSRRKSSGFLEDDKGVLDAAVQWGKQKGEQLGDLHEQMWDSIGRK